MSVSHSEYVRLDDPVFSVAVHAPVVIVAISFVILLGRPVHSISCFLR